MPSLHKDVKQAVEATQLPGPIHQLIHRGELIKQGAEAKVFKTTLYPSPSITASDLDSPASPPPSSVPILLKYRFPKLYRHPTLDAQLTRQRLTSEARALVRCQKAGVRVPGLRVVDVRQGAIGMEWVAGWSVREVLGGGQEGDELPEEDAGCEEAKAEEQEGDEEDIGELLRQQGVDEDLMLRSIGLELAKMHLADIIHGDLTTSNMMVRLFSEERRRAGGGRENEVFEIVLIDFGLSTSSPMAEERAVDLYVLERAFSSTHPVLPGTRPHFEGVLEGYRAGLVEGGRKVKGKKDAWEQTWKRLEEVQLRGRKRSMVG
ncbi:hypothetical protein JCM10207_006999 [Rhodosporidiobolus poonsookiae]